MTAVDFGSSSSVLVSDSFLFFCHYFLQEVSWAAVVLKCSCEVFHLLVLLILFCRNVFGSLDEALGNTLLNMRGVVWPERTIPISMRCSYDTHLPPMYHPPFMKIFATGDTGDLYATGTFVIKRDSTSKLHPVWWSLMRSSPQSA